MQPKIRFTIFIIFFAFAQTNLAQKIPSGFYKRGGDCPKIGDICSGWYISADSSFYCFAVGNYLTEIGKGRVVKFIDSTFYFEFENDYHIPGRLRYQHNAESKNDPDSIYFNIKVSRLDYLPLPYPLLAHYGNQFIGLIEKNGLLKKSLFKISNNRYDTLTISGKETGTDPIQFMLNPSTNNHKISAVISGEDSAYCRSIGLKHNSLNKDTSIITLRERTKQKGVFILPANQEKSSLLTKLSEAKKRQKYLSSIIDELINFIKIN